MVKSVKSDYVNNQITSDNKINNKGKTMKKKKVEKIEKNKNKGDKMMKKKNKGDKMMKKKNKGDKMMKKEKAEKIENKKNKGDKMMKKKPKPNTKPTSKITRLGPGDRVDITQLLFTKQRDFLIKSNSDQLVKAHHLEGKVIVLFFASVYDNIWVRDSYHLTQIYNDIYHYSPFEVVFVPLACPPTCSISPELYEQPPLQLFNSIFSTMPWTAIPHTDISSRELIQSTFGFNDANVFPNSTIIDPSGLVLTLCANDLFSVYGSPAYPFTKQRLQFLDSQDRALLNRPSITQLLTSPERDYLLSNNGIKVPVLSLDNKVVALHFFEEGQPLYRRADGTFVDITATLVASYKDLVKKYDNFEVVLIYLHDSWTTFGHTTGDLFWMKFKTMPWLALPYKDPVCKKLMRIFNYPLTLDAVESDPRLVIIGPQGEFCERFAADIFMNDGTEAYPFTRKSAQGAGQII